MDLLQKLSLLFLFVFCRGFFTALFDCIILGFFVRSYLCFKSGLRVCSFIKNGALYNDSVHLCSNMSYVSTENVILFTFIFVSINSVFFLKNFIKDNNI